MSIATVTTTDYDVGVLLQYDDVLGKTDRVEIAYWHKTNSDLDRQRIIKYAPIRIAAGKAFRLAKAAETKIAGGTEVPDAVEWLILELRKEADA